MSTALRWTLLTALAPILMGSAYIVTQAFLPADHPLYGSVIRALPAGFLLLLIARKRPRGAWWWKSLVLGALNFGGFFVFIYIAAQLLPSSIASTLMAASPIVMMLLAWPIVSERPRLLALLGGVLGMAGVFIMLFTGAVTVNPLGVLASLGAMLMATFGMLLTKRWRSDVDVIAATSWQLIAGGLVLVPVAVIVEGAPPALTPTELLGFAYLTTVATALGFCIWFSGLRHLRAGTVALLGLLTPVTGVVLGVLVASEPFGLNQILGMVLVFVGILVGQPQAFALLGRLTGRRAAPLPVETGLQIEAVTPNAR